MDKAIAKISVTSPIVINRPTRDLLVGETKSSFVKRFLHLNNKNNVCKQISLLYGSVLYTWATMGDKSS